MSRRYFRVFDSRGTVEVTSTETRARQFKSQGYPVEVWELKQESGVSIHDAKNQLYQLSGGSGPSYISGGEKLGDLEEVTA